MTTRLNPYLHFKDTARQAMEFYRSVLGGELTLSTFGEAQMASNDAEKPLIMHAQLETPSGFTLMASDTPAHVDYVPAAGIAVSLSGDDDAELRAYWEKLGAGANITQPLEKAPWGDSFGMLVDKFGITWFVNIVGAGH